MKSSSLEPNWNYSNLLQWRLCKSVKYVKDWRKQYFNPSSFFATYHIIQIYCFEIEINSSVTTTTWKCFVTVKFFAAETFLIDASWEGVVTYLPTVCVTSCCVRWRRFLRVENAFLNHIVTNRLAATVTTLTTYHAPVDCGIKIRLYSLLPIPILFKIVFYGY